MSMTKQLKTIPKQVAIENKIQVLQGTKITSSSTYFLSHKQNMGGSHPHEPLKFNL